MLRKPNIKPISSFNAPFRSNYELRSKIGAPLKEIEKKSKKKQNIFEKIGGTIENLVEKPGKTIKTVGKTIEKGYKTLVPKDLRDEILKLPGANLVDDIAKQGYKLATDPKGFGKQFTKADTYKDILKAGLDTTDKLVQLKAQGKLNTAYLEDLGMKALEEGQQNAMQIADKYLDKQVQNLKQKYELAKKTYEPQIRIASETYSDINRMRQNVSSLFENSSSQLNAMTSNVMPEDIENNVNVFSILQEKPYLSSLLI